MRVVAQLLLFLTMLPGEAVLEQPPRRAQGKRFPVLGLGGGQLASQRRRFVLRREARVAVPQPFRQRGADRVTEVLRRDQGPDLLETLRPVQDRLEQPAFAVGLAQPLLPDSQLLAPPEPLASQPSPAFSRRSEDWT